MTNKITGKKEIKGYVKEVNGIWHIVITYYDKNGKRKFASMSTKLKIRGNKKNASRMMEEIIDLFEIPKTVKKLI